MVDGEMKWTVWRTDDGKRKTAKSNMEGGVFLSKSDPADALRIRE